MPGYEYKVIPAPRKPSKIKGVRGTDQKFAASLAAIMNQYGRDGWEYQRTDTLPCEERQGLTGRTTTFQNMLVFRRVIDDGPVEMSMRTPTVAPAAAPLALPAEVYEPEDAEPAIAEEQTSVVMPSFRTTVAETAAPALAAATHDAPEGKAPRIGAPRTTDTGRHPDTPTITVQ